MRELEDEDAQQEQQEAKAKTEAQKASDLKSAYRFVMSSVEGRLVIHDILQSLGADKSPLVPGSQDLTYSLIGRQKAGIDLTDKLKSVSPVKYIAMIKENME